ncbi:MAG: flagellar filament capping protein FliD [Nitrospina sp.]|nr:flagellar filament capping protein FliD [Nitrospina sp.]MBT6716263.1 flagellar filament capping protein FliD [Nitrospina sp.]
MAENAIFGINSNLDTGGIIDNLITLQRQPITIVEAKRALEEAKLLSFQDLKDRLQNFKSVVNTLNTESRFLSTLGEFSNNSSTDTNKVATLTTSSSATSGTFSLVVNNLARETKLLSTGFASTSTEIGQGTLSITVGTTTTNITIDETNNTVDGLRLAINNSGLSVNANFLNDGSATDPVKLVISGTQTGEDNAVTASVTNTLFGFGQETPVSFTETQAAQNASFVLDGVAVTKGNNTVTDVITGTTLQLESAGSGLITLSPDEDTIKEKIQNYVDGFNEIMAHLNSELSLTESTGETGVLFANFTVQNLQQTLRENITDQIIGVTGDFNYLSQIGIRTQSDGTLTVDDGALSTAIASDIGNVTQLFSSSGTTTNSTVTFVGFTDNTDPGTYSVRVSGGVPQLAASGTTTFTDAVGNGNFFAGAPGTGAEGLNFRIGNLADGDYGTITLSVGAAQITNRILARLTDASLEGPLEAEVDSATDTIADFDETIADLEERLALFETNIRSRFTNLEVVLGRLNSQRDAFDSSIAGIQSLFQGGN